MHGRGARNGHSKPRSTPDRSKSQVPKSSTPRRRSISGKSPRVGANSGHSPSEGLGSERMLPVGAVKGVIRLIGAGGAGKTTVGLALANRLGIPFIDLDQQF